MLYNAFAYNTVTYAGPSGFTALPDAVVVIIVDVDAFATIDPKNTVILSA